MNNFIQSSTMEAVTCTACGLLCDDLSINRDAEGALKVTANGCAKSVAFFERTFNTTQARIAGKTADLKVALDAATNLIKQSQRPLISGLSADVQGMRAVMNLAEKTGATIDHMNSKSSMRNLMVMQNSGWQVTTLTEVKNRVDLLLVIGTDIVSYFPRFFERNVWNKETMFDQDTSSREVVYLGGRNLDTSAGTSPSGKTPTVLPCDTANIPEVLAVLRALVLGKKLVATEVAGIALSDLSALAERLKAAKYAVVAWTSSALDFAHAELTVQNITGLIEKVNTTTRCAGLPLGGNEGDVSAYNTSSWISGYPYRMSYHRNYPDYEPYQYSTDRMLAEQETDALIWISALNPDRSAPKSTTPTVVIGHPEMKFEQEPAIFIPVAVPGIDCKGTQFRSDSSVSLPLQKLRDRALPTLSDVLSAIESSL